MRILHICMIGLATVAAALDCAAQTQNYPERPVKIVVPFPPAGAVDIMARLIAQKLSERSGSHFYVENLAGAGGDIGTRAAATAAADGHTILFTSPDFVIRPLVKSNVPYDPARSFAPVTLVATAPAMISVHSSLPARTMNELIELVRANPGKYTLGTPGYGTAPHLEGERLYRQAYGLDVTFVPFQGFGPAVTSTVAGHTTMLGAPVPVVVSHVKEGSLRALAVASLKRASALPDMPTLDEIGIKGQEADFFGSVLVPAGTPKSIIELLHRQIATILSLPDVKDRLAALGFEPVGNTPEEFGYRIKSETAKWREVVRAANIRID